MQVAPNKRKRRRNGFTLTELMISTALTAVIMSQAIAALVSSQRLLEETVADLELTLQSRALREKLLFNIVPEEGGLMNASLSELAVENKKNKGGNGLKFKPRKGASNRLALGSDKKLSADRGKARWIAGGTPVFQTEEIFQVVSNDTGTVIINLDLALHVSTRKYKQQSQAQVQIMNP